VTSTEGKPRLHYGGVQWEMYFFLTVFLNENSHTIKI